MPVYDSKYSYELWTKNGLLLMDLGKRAHSRTFTKSRNQPDSITFDLLLDEFEATCRKLGIDPRQVLITGSTEVRVKRLGTYLTGGQLVYREVNITSPTDKTISCRVEGFLGLFRKRYTGQTPSSGLVQGVFTAATGNAMSRKDLAWELIRQSQALTNGDYGITRGIARGSDTPYDKTYNRTMIYDALQAMTELATDPIDIEFTYDKVFNTYASIGSLRTDIVLEYPGNVLALNVPDDSTDLTNEAISIGSGAADGTQTVRFQVDLPSQTDRFLRQDIVNSSGTDDSDNGVQDAANAEIEAKSQPINVPNLTLNGNVAPYVSDYGIGDIVVVKISGYALLSDINGMYRIEKIDVQIDDNDSETVTLGVSEVAI